MVNWVKKLTTNANTQVPVMLVGNRENGLLMQLNLWLLDQNFKVTIVDSTQSALRTLKGKNHPSCIITGFEVSEGANAANLLSRMNKKDIPIACVTRTESEIGMLKNHNPDFVMTQADLTSIFDVEKRITDSAKLFQHKIESWRSVWIDKSTNIDLP